MKWGYKNGTENGKRKRENSVEVDSIGNKFKRTDSGGVVYLDSRANTTPKAHKVKSSRNTSTKYYNPDVIVQGFKKLYISSISPKAINRGKDKILKIL